MEDTITDKMYPATKSSSMSRFRAMYLKYCKSMSITPFQCVVKACESELMVLDMSNNCLTPEHCSVIAKCLQHIQHFSEANFSDCLIGDEGLQNLFHPLKYDYQLQSLILKGNNIHSKGAKLLGKLLKCITSLERLSLEWNNVGTNEDGFRELCEGLVLNTSLQYLDLRSNSIDPTGAIQLSTVFLCNKSLVEVDLRWNNIGVIGGRALLSSLARNHTLLSLSVDGCNIPRDMVDAIGTTLSLRFAKNVSDLHHKAEAKQLADKLQQLHMDKRQQIRELLGKLDDERSLFLETTQLSQYEMSDLKAQLQEEEALRLTLEQRIKSSESALQESLNECEKQKQAKDALVTELEVKEKKYADKIASLKQQICSIQHEQEISMTSALSDNKEITTLKSEKQHLQDKCKELSISLDSLETEHKHELSSLHDQCQYIKEQHIQHLKQIHKTHQNEILAHMKRYDEHQAECQKRITSYNEKVLYLEQEVSSLSQKLVVASRKAAEEAQRSGQSLKTQEIQSSYLKDQLQIVEKSAEKERKKVKELQKKLDQLEEDVSTKEHQVKESKMTIQELNKQLETNEYQFQMSRKSHQAEVEKLISRQSALNQELIALKQDYEDAKQDHLKIQTIHNKELTSWLGEKEELQKSVGHYKHLLHQLQEAESHRTTLLKTAMQNYLSASPHLE